MTCRKLQKRKEKLADKRCCVNIDCAHVQSVSAFYFLSFATFGHLWSEIKFPFRIFWQRADFMVLSITASRLGSEDGMHPQIIIIFDFQYDR